MPRLHELEAGAEADMPASASWQVRDGDPGVRRNVQQCALPQRPQRGAMYWGFGEAPGDGGAVGPGVPPGDGVTVPRPVGPWRPLRDRCPRAAE